MTVFWQNDRNLPHNIMTHGWNQRLVKLAFLDIAHDDMWAWRQIIRIRKWNKKSIFDRNFQWLIFSIISQYLIYFFLDLLENGTTTPEGIGWLEGPNLDILFGQ